MGRTMSLSEKNDIKYTSEGIALYSNVDISQEEREGKWA